MNTSKPNEIYLLMKKSNRIAFGHQKNQYAKRTRAKNPRKSLRKNIFLFAYKHTYPITCIIQPKVFSWIICWTNYKFCVFINTTGRGKTVVPIVWIHICGLTIADPGPRATVVLYADPRQVDRPCVSNVVPDFPVDVNFPFIF